MRYRLSQHARDEMARREIPEAFVARVLASPQQVIGVQNGRKAYQSKLDFGKGKMFLLRVIVADAVDPAVVITLYRTSKIEKYWR